LAAAGVPDAAAGRRRGRLVRAVNDLKRLVEATEKIIEQARPRIKGIMPDGATRVVSLHDVQARPIVKGRLGKPVEFGLYAAATLRNTTISLIRLTGRTKIAATLRHQGRSISRAVGSSSRRLMRRARPRCLLPRAPAWWVAASRACRIRVVLTAKMSAGTGGPGWPRRPDATRGGPG